MEARALHVAARAVKVGGNTLQNALGERCAECWLESNEQKVAPEEHMWKLWPRNGPNMTQT